MEVEDFYADLSALAAINAMPTVLEMICRTTGMGVAAVARVTAERWVACQVRDEINFGLSVGTELEIAATFCNSIRISGKPVIFNDATTDLIYRDHPIALQYGIKSYISVPIYQGDGRFFGTLCGIGTTPAQVNDPQTLSMFECFANLIGHQLKTSATAAAATSQLVEAQKAAQLREQFIAVLGHDLRNPLASIANAIELLGRLPIERQAPVLKIAGRSVLRMRELIDNILDFARGRLAGGLPLDLSTSDALAASLTQIIDELQTAWPERQILATFDEIGPLHCDTARIAQLLSNLLGNAIAHGIPSEPIRVTGKREANDFVLSVHNYGEPIAPHMIDRLFQPFYRDAENPNRDGLGLGLYIVDQIARAHGGKMIVRSATDETCFEFRMPINIPRLSPCK